METSDLSFGVRVIVCEMVKNASPLLLALLFLGLMAPASAAPPITSAAFSPDGQSVLIGSQAGIEVRSWPNLEVQRRLETQLAHVHDLAFSPNRNVLAASGGRPAEEGVVELFSWPEGKRLAGQTTHDDLIYGLAWRPDGKQLALASADHAVTLHNISSASTPVLAPSDHRLEGHSRGVLAAAYLPAGDLVVTAGVDQSLRVWDVATRQLRRTLDNHTADVRDLAVRPLTNAQQPIIASASADRTVRLWQPNIGRLTRFARLPSEPLAIDWTPDGGRLIASCVDGHVRVIDPDSVQVIVDLPAVDGWAYTVAAAPDARQAIVGGTNGQLKRVAIDPPAEREAITTSRDAR